MSSLKIVADSAAVFNFRKVIMNFHLLNLSATIKLKWLFEGYALNASYYVNYDLWILYINKVPSKTILRFLL